MFLYGREIGLHFCTWNLSHRRERKRERRQTGRDPCTPFTESKPCLLFAVTEGNCAHMPTLPSGGRSESPPGLPGSRAASEESGCRSSDHKDGAPDGESEPGKGHCRRGGAKGQANATIRVLSYI